VQIRLAIEGNERYVELIGHAVRGVQACLEEIDAAGPADVERLEVLARARRADIRRLLDRAPGPLAADDPGSPLANLTAALKAPQVQKAPAAVPSRRVIQTRG
jgi:hypothetical protein